MSKRSIVFVVKSALEQARKAKAGKGSGLTLQIHATNTVQQNNCHFSADEQPLLM
jgi:hypothetical protein